MELKFRNHPQQRRTENPGQWYAEEQIRFVGELLHRETGPSPTSKELLLVKIHCKR